MPSNNERASLAELKQQYEEKQQELYAIDFDNAPGDRWALLEEMRRLEIELANSEPA